jgi:hypothetical protein
MTILKNCKEYTGIILLLLLGIAFRLIPLGQYQFSHDELSALSRTVYGSFSDEMTYGVQLGDTHPALIQVFLFYWVKLFGYSEIAIKLPFLLCGIAAIALIYRFGHRFFSYKTGLSAAAIVSMSFIFLLYSSYARMYITGLLFCLLLLYAAYSIAFGPEAKRKHYLLLMLSCALAAYNHHMSCLFAASVAALALFYVPKERRRRYLLACLGAVLLYLPHLPVTLYQFSIGGIGASSGGWLTPPRNTEVWYFVKALFGCGLSGKLIFAALLVLMVASVLKLVPISKKQVFLFWIFLGNYLVIHLYSVFKNPILQYSVLLFCGLCLILFLCSFTEFLKPKQLYGFAATIVLLLGFQTVIKKQIFSRVHVQEFESQVQTTLDFQKRYGKEQVSSIFKTEDFFVYLYEKKYHTRLDYLSLEDSALLRPQLFREHLKKLRASYMVLSGVGVEDIALVKEYFPYLVFHREDYFRNILVFSKQDAHYADASLVREFPLMNSDLDLYINSHKELRLKNDSISFDIKAEDDEFPFNLGLPLHKGQFKLGDFVLAELSYTGANRANIENERLCMAVSEQGKEGVFFKNSNYRDYYDSSKALQTTYLEYFVGVDNSVWERKGMTLNTFVWKAKESAYVIRQAKLRQYRYNPTKWVLWE